MPRIETQNLPSIDDYVDEYPQDDAVIEPAQYRRVETVSNRSVVHGKSAKLTKLEALETKAHELKESLVRNWVDLAEAISAIIDTDVWRESGYTNRRDYCDNQLGWSYEWCRRIINGAVAVQQTAALSEAPSNAVASQLAQLPEPEREQAIKTLTANDAPLTAERVRAYREVMDQGELPPTNETIVKFMDLGVERDVLRLARKHSQPAEMLNRLAKEIE